MKIAEMAVEAKPRERAALHGVDKLDDFELLALILRTGSRRHSVLYIAQEVLRLAGGIDKLGLLTIQDLTAIHGISRTKATEIFAVIEIHKRMLQPGYKEKVTLNHPQKIVAWLRSMIGFSQQEQFLVLYLNVRNELMSYKTLFTGTLDRSMVHPREIFKFALTCSAVHVILVHNHPAGSLMPSPMDCETTAALVRAGALLGIGILDHLIITGEGYHSILASHHELFEG